MRCYNHQHQCYCCIGFRARLLAVCVCEQAGTLVFQTSICYYCDGK
jgi:hypothetical protein